MSEYVRASEEHAGYVANTIRKAMLADSEIVCVLMGRILADHIAVNEKYDRHDVIILHALGSATDDDIKFDMMRSVQNGELPLGEEYIDCIELGLANRLFKEGQGQKDIEGKPTFYDFVAPKEVANKLQYYLDEIKQVVLCGANM